MIYALLGPLAVGLSLGLLGSGGSILTVPVLVYLLQRHRPERQLPKMMNPRREIGLD